MKGALFTLLPMALFLVALAATSVAMHVYRLKRYHSRWKNPLTKDLSREPGHSLRRAIEEKTIDLYGLILMVALLPILVYATHVSSSYFGGERETALRIAVSSALGIGLVTYSIAMLLKARKALDGLRLGWEGEMAVGQELNQLMRDGCRIFHDFPGENFNIDHIVVGSAGVFAIETKMKKKPLDGDAKAACTVVCAGSYLQFPGWRETESLTQAVRQAKWLSRFIENSAGEIVTVKPMIALPGWFVSRSGTSPVIVFNPRNSGWLFRDAGKPILSKRQIDMISFQLDERCRVSEIYPHLDGAAILEEKRLFPVGRERSGAGK